MAEFPLNDTGGTIPGVVDSKAFSLSRGRDKALPILLAIPHDGQIYPDDVLQGMRMRHDRHRLEDRHVGLIADHISSVEKLSVLRAHAPRAMIDLNRSLKDIDWTMVSGVDVRTHRPPATFRARAGLGLVPRRVSGVGELWRAPLRRVDLEQRIACIYEPYHQALQNELERLRDQHGIALLLDLHSMPPLRRTVSDEAAPEFVVGDRFNATCDAIFAETAIQHLREKGRRVTHNKPYSGGHVLERYGQPHRGIHAMQLEVCRGLYLDNDLLEPSARLSVAARLVEGVVHVLGKELRARDRGWLAQAAE